MSGPEDDDLTTVGDLFLEIPALRDELLEEPGVMAFRNPNGGPTIWLEDPA